jgi:hypothetical protein
MYYAHNDLMAQGCIKYSLGLAIMTLILSPLILAFRYGVLLVLNSVLQKY